MKEQKSAFSEIFRGLVDIAHLGLSVVMPIILCSWLGVFLKSKYHLADIWVVLLILLGVSSGICSAVSYIKSYLKRIAADEKKSRSENIDKKQ